MKSWQEWIEEIGDDCGEPLVYDRFGNEIVDPWWVLSPPTADEILAEIGEEPLPSADGKPEWWDAECVRDDAECTICNAVGAIMQREQDEIDRIAEEAEHDQWLAEQRDLDELHQLVSDSLGIDDWNFAATGSRYARFRGFKIRVSDHKQVAGGGFCQERQTRMGEADADFFLTNGTHHWDRESIRRHVAKILLNSMEVYK